MHPISLLSFLAGTAYAAVAGDLLSTAEKLARNAHSALSADPPFKLAQTDLPHPSYTYEAEWPKVTAAVHARWESLKHEVAQKKSHAVEAAKAQMTGIDHQHEAHQAAFYKRFFARDVEPDDELARNVEDDPIDYDWDYEQHAKRDVEDEDEAPIDYKWDYEQHAKRDFDSFPEKVAQQAGKIEAPEPTEEPQPHHLLSRNTADDITLPFKPTAIPTPSASPLPAAEATPGPGEKGGFFI